MKRQCSDCAKPIAKANKTGLCRVCLTTTPAGKAYLSAVQVRIFQTDPLRREKSRQCGIEISNRPGMRQRRSEAAKARELWKLAQAGLTPEVRKRAGQSISEHRLAHIPPHLREQYKGLVKNKGFKAAEAFQMIREQEAAEMMRFRRKIGAA
jgi:hypothetical protein